MKTANTFTKDVKLQNVLFDEYFAEYQTITVVAFNYDGAGTALCQCNGSFAEIKKTNLRRIIFGAEKSAIEAYLLGIFDPDTETDDVQRQHGEPIFRLAALKTMKKYDVANLAKETLKTLQAQSTKHLCYYTPADRAPVKNEGQQGQQC